MSVVQLTNREEIETYFRQEDVELHLYEIGDLDDFFWPNTQWWALKENGAIKFILLFYIVDGSTVILALGKDVQVGQKLVQNVLLPKSFYSHFSVGIKDALSEAYVLEHHGLYHKMTLVDKSIANQVDTNLVVPLGPSESKKIMEFYSTHYPGNWFDMRMLESGETYGIKNDNGDLLAIAGIHVFSKQYSVSSIGNVAVHRDHRNKGLAKKVTAGLVKSLLQSTTSIGLNVLATNIAAIRCYESLGFKIKYDYEEIQFDLKE